jgi:ketosteroid isomerase-like protein
MSKFLLLIALLTAAATAAFAQTTAKSAAPDNSVEQAVLRATQDWLDADERHDRAALDKLIASDFLGTAPGGRTVYKRDIIPAEGTAEGHSLGITGQDLNVRVFGDTAIVTGRGIAKTPERAAQGELRFTVVFVKRADRWQMVSAHLSPVPKE